MSKILVNDIFDELFNENKRLLNALLFADKCIKVLNEMKIFLDLNSNEIKVNLVSKQLKVFNDLLQTIEEVFREKNSFVIEVKEEVNEESVKQLKSSPNKPSEVIEKIKDKKKTNKKKGKTRFTSKKKRNQRKIIESKADPKADNNSIDSQWVCDYSECGQRFRGEKSLRYHILMHKKNGLNCDYPGCHFTANHISKLINHERKHTGEKPFECNVCHKKFKTEQSIDLHKQKIHNLLEEPVICGIDGCDKEFKSDLSLKHHRRVQHQDKRFVCDHPGCHFKSRFRGTLLIHHTKHRDERPFTCPACGQSYKLLSTLTTHMKLHDPNSRVRPTERTVRCTHDNCNKMFVSKRHLRMHFKNCHSDNWIHCDWPGCEYKARRTESIASHMNSHSTEYNVACIWPNCDKKFKTRQNMRVHLLIHKGDKRHACHWPGCQYRCLTGGNLKIHINNVHNKAIK